MQPKHAAKVLALIKHRNGLPRKTGDSLSLEIIKTYNHKVTEQLRLEGTFAYESLSSIKPCSQQGSNKLPQKLFQSSPEHIQRWRFHSLSGQLVPIFDHTEGKNQNKTQIPTSQQNYKMPMFQLLSFWKTGNERCRVFSSPETFDSSDTCLPSPFSQKTPLQTQDDFAFYLKILMNQSTVYRANRTFHFISFEN